MEKDTTSKEQSIDNDPYFYKKLNKLIYPKDKELFSEIVETLLKKSKFEEQLSNLKKIFKKREFKKLVINRGAFQESNCSVSLQIFISEVIKHLEDIKAKFSNSKSNASFDCSVLNKELIDFLCEQIVEHCISFSINTSELKRSTKNLILPHQQAIIYGFTKKERNEQFPVVLRKIINEEQSVADLKEKFEEIIHNLRFEESKYDLFLKNNSKLFVTALCKIKTCIYTISDMKNKGYKVNKDFNIETLKKDLGTYILDGKNVKFDKDGTLINDKCLKIFVNNRLKSSKK